MKLWLRVDNMTSLPDGGPIRYEVIGKRTVDIGRHAHLDWVLPDDEQVVSRRHCELRWRDGAYWLKDLSSNGTFVNGSNRRIAGEHRLNDGDRLEIGPYIIAVAIEGELQMGSDAAGVVSSRQPDGDSDWTVSENVAPPMDRKELNRSNISQGLSVNDPLDWQVSFGGFQPTQSNWIDSDPRPEDSISNQSFKRTDPPSMGEVLIPVQRDRGSPNRDQQVPPKDEASRASTPITPDPWTQARRLELPADADTENPTSTQPSEGFFSDGEGDRRVNGRSTRNDDVVPTGADTRDGIGAASTPDANAILRALAEAARIDPDIWRTRDPIDVAKEIGTSLAICSEGFRDLMQGRSATKRSMRSINQTMVGSMDNNPLRFSASTSEAMDRMFGNGSPGYLRSDRAFSGAIHDLKRHQLDTMAAIQKTLIAFAMSLDPNEIDASQSDGGLSGLLVPKKSKNWDEYVRRWDLLTAGDDSAGYVASFMRRLGESYDDSGRK